MPQEPIAASVPTGRPVREWWLVAGLAVLALTVRVLYLADWAANPLFHVPMGDELHFHQTALALLQQGPAPGVFVYQPFYSWYLAGLYWLFGADLAVARTVQLLVGVLTVLLFYGLGRELGGKWTGVITALLAAVYGPMVFFEGTLLATSLVLALVVAAEWSLLVAARRNRLGLVALSGLCLGLATMARPNLAILLPVAAVWIWLRPWTPKRKLAALGVALVAVVAGLLPSWLHNARAGEPWMPVSGSGGVNFFIGNNAQATGAFHLPRGIGFSGDTHRDFTDNMRAIAETTVGHPLSPGKVSSFWFQQGLDFWKRQPLDSLRLLGRKLLMGLNAEEIPVHHPYAFARKVIPVLGWLPGFALVFPLALIGLLFGSGTSARRLLGSLGWAYLLGLLAFFVVDRLRLINLAMWLTLAGLGAVAVWEHGRRRVLQRNLGVLAVFAATLAVTHVPVLSPAAQERLMAQGYNRMGKAYGEQGRLPQAARCFELALLCDPDDGRAHARTNLGLVYEKRGDQKKAEQLYRQAAQRVPDASACRIHLARLLESQGRLAEAIDWWRQVAALMADPRRAQVEIQRLQGKLSGMDRPKDPGTQSAEGRSSD